MSHFDNEQSALAEQSEDLVKAAWLEWLVTNLRRTGNPHLVEMYVEVERWFCDVELGLKPGEGPTIFCTLRNLDTINRRNRRVFQRPANQEQQYAAERRNRWRALFYAQQGAAQAPTA